MANLQKELWRFSAANRVLFAALGGPPPCKRLAGVPCLNHLGWREQSVILESMRSAAYLIIPSICFETFSRVLVEAYGCGLPVIASRLGALRDLVRDGETGLLFEAGLADDLAAKIAWAEAHPERMRDMGRAARAAYEASYTPEINYRQLMAIYHEAIAVRRGAERA